MRECELGDQHTAHLYMCVTISLTYRNSNQDLLQEETQRGVPGDQT